MSDLANNRSDCSGDVVNMMNSTLINPWRLIVNVREWLPLDQKKTISGDKL